MSENVKYRILWYVYRGHWLNWAILAATWPANIGTEPVSHCSLWEPGKDGRFTELDDILADAMFAVGGISEPSYWGHCWTSTTRKTHLKDKAGTKVRPASQVLNHPERWYYTEHSVDKEKFEYARVYAIMRVANNKGYSYRDLSRFVMPLWMLKGLRLADNGREICSEHVAQWLVDMGVLDRNTTPSPRRLCKQVVLATGSPLKRLSDDKMIRTGKWEK